MKTWIVSSSGCGNYIFKGQNYSIEETICVNTVHIIFDRDDSYFEQRMDNVKYGNYYFMRIFLAFYNKAPNQINYDSFPVNWLNLKHYDEKYCHRLDRAVTNYTF